MTKLELIRKVNESAGSLFTKQDVINLVNELESVRIDLNHLEVFKDRVLAILDDSDTSAIEIDQDNCSYDIRNGNEIRIDDVELDVDDYIRNIKHDIEELFESMEEFEREFEAEVKNEEAQN